mmetsp:Transcript_34110/g.90981  ORF Transcript_34110/g.90981 Transcript_34110/m.90981 type:complete len:366 (+) Transcript_34110:1384-2481(+)
MVRERHLVVSLRWPRRPTTAERMSARPARPRLRRSDNDHVACTSPSTSAGKAEIRAAASTCCEKRAYALPVSCPELGFFKKVTSSAVPKLLSQSWNSFSMQSWWGRCLRKTSRSVGNGSPAANTNSSKCSPSHSSVCAGGWEVTNSHFKVHGRSPLPIVVCPLRAATVFFAASSTRKIAYTLPSLRRTCITNPYCMHMSRTSSRAQPSGREVKSTVVTPGSAASAVLAVTAGTVALGMVVGGVLLNLCRLGDSSTLTPSNGCPCTEFFGLTVAGREAAAAAAASIEVVWCSASSSFTFKGAFNDLSGTRGRTCGLPEICGEGMTAGTNGTEALGPGVMGVEGVKGVGVLDDRKKDGDCRVGTVLP